MVSIWFACGINQGGGSAGPTIGRIRLVALSQTTPALKVGDIERKWYIIDAEGKVLGRIASDVAYILRGKHKPNFSPYLDNGDHVIVINAEKVAVTGGRVATKMYYRHSGYPGGLRATTMQRMLETHPERVVESAVRGMLPGNKLGAAMLSKLRVYAGPTHPHQGQTPLDITQVLDAGRGTMRPQK
jgi:large subunit ribosomal protein L13